MDIPQHSQASDGVTIAITGMTCSGCVNAVTRALSRVPGVTDVRVDLDAGRAQVSGNASPQSLVSAVEKAGYGAEPVQGETAEKEGRHGRGGCCG